MSPNSIGNPSLGSISTWLQSGSEDLSNKVGQVDELASSEKTSKITEVAEQFEEVFMSLVLKQMRSSLSEDGLFSGDKSDVYGGMFDMFMSKSLASSRQLGIATAIETYFHNQNGTQMADETNGNSK